MRHMEAVVNHLQFDIIKNVTTDWESVQHDEEQVFFAVDEDAKPDEAISYSDSACSNSIGSL